MLNIFTKSKNSDNTVESYTMDEIINKLFDEIENLKQKIDEIKQENNELKQDNNELNSDINKLKVDNYKLKQETNQLKIETSTLKIDTYKLNQETHKLKSDIDNNNNILYNIQLTNNLNKDTNQISLITDYKINIKSLPIINHNSYDLRQTVHFDSDIQELDLSNIDIKPGKINWHFLTDFYNLKTIILNYSFNGYNLDENEMYLPVNTIILRYTEKSCIPDNLFDFLDSTIKYLIDNDNLLLHVIIEDLTKHEYKCNLKSYNKWLETIKKKYIKQIKLTVT